ncbi:MAG: hydrogenase maturation protease [Dehalobacterium sp.]
MHAGQIKVIGCGNLLFGDDGFGPAVISCLEEKFPVDHKVELVDAGTGAGELLLDAYLGEAKIKTIILIDAMDLGLPTGTVKEVSMENIPSLKRDDFSIHQFPSLDILSELKRKGVDVRIVGCQVETIPEEVCCGLSEVVAMAVPKTALMINDMIKNP